MFVNRGFGVGSIAIAAGKPFQLHNILRALRIKIQNEIHMADSDVHESSDEKNVNSIYYASP